MDDARAAGMITCERLFDGARWLGPSSVVFEEGRIISIDPAHSAPDHHLVIPGMVDLQMNGYATLDVSDCDAEQLCALDAALMRLGTLHWLATIVTAPLDRLTEKLMFLDEVQRSGACPGMVGVHLEGPFLGGVAGAHRKDWIISIDEEWLSRLPSSVRLVTLAPEQPAAVRATRALHARGIIVSMGHTTASSAQVNDVHEAGATMVTHLYNAMTGVHHRDDGIALQVLTSDGLTAGLIADMAHVSPSAVALAFRAKSAERICLVSDSVAWESPRAVARGVKVMDGVPRLSDGTLAGSATPLSEAVRRCVFLAGVSVEDAVAASTRTPARMLGTPGLGRIEVGGPANMVALDDRLCVEAAWRGLVSHRG